MQQRAIASARLIRRKRRFANGFDIFVQRAKMRHYDFAFVGGVEPGGAGAQFCCAHRLCRMPSRNEQMLRRLVERSQQSQPRQQNPVRWHIGADQRRAPEHIRADNPKHLKTGMSNADQIVEAHARKRRVGAQPLIIGVQRVAISIDDAGAAEGKRHLRS